MTGNSLRLAGKILVLVKLNGLDDLCEGRPYKAKDLKSQGQGLTLGTVDLGGAMHSTEFPSSFEIVNCRET